MHYYYSYIIERQQHAEDILILTIRRFETVKKKYAICIICVSLTDFQETLWVLDSMFYHFKSTTIFSNYVYIRKNKR